MTTQGIDGLMNPGIKMEACRACLLSANAYIERTGEEEYIRAVTDERTVRYLNTMPSTVRTIHSQ